MCKDSTQRSGGTAGSTLLITMMSVLVLSMIAGAIVSSISSRYPTAHHSAAWNEALVVSESAVDMTLAQLTALLPDVRVNTEGIAVATTPPDWVESSGLQMIS